MPFSVLSLFSKKLFFLSVFSSASLHMFSISISVITHYQHLIVPWERTSRHSAPAIAPYLLPRLSLSLQASQLRPPRTKTACPLSLFFFSLVPFFAVIIKWNQRNAMRLTFRANNDRAQTMLISVAVYVWLTLSLTYLLARLLQTVRCLHRLLLPLNCFRLIKKKGKEKRKTNWLKSKANK